MSEGHGGYRGEGRGFGRPNVLKKPKKVLIIIEEEHDRLIHQLEKKYKVKGRSAVVRKILDRMLKRAG